MREELEQLVAAGKIRGQHVDRLVALVEGSYCQHRGWGFGKIIELDPVFGRLRIDFPGKPGHSMDLDFAAESLKPIPRDHILVRKAEDLEGLRQLAAGHHLELVKLVLHSYGGEATVDAIQQVLVPEVIASDWKKWWETAKREMKKDGHFQAPVKRSEPVVYQAQEVPLQERLMADFRAAKGLKARLVAGAELLRNLEDLTDKQAVVVEAVAMLNSEIASHQRTMSALAVEGIFTRDDLCTAVGLTPTPGELTTLDVWAQVEYPARVLEQIPAPKHKRALQSFKAAKGVLWHEALLAVVNAVSAKLCGECVILLVEEGKLERLKDHLARLISQHQASSELLLWLAKEGSENFADSLGPEAFRAMLAAIERDLFNEKKANRLRDYILDDPDLLGALIASTDVEIIKDVTRALQLSPSFGDMDKRSLLARIVKQVPAVQALITGEHGKQDYSLIVSWESLERRKREYDELVQKTIPANSRDIALARSYGDLSENHEYKAAKERHGLLMRKKTELEGLLVRARGTDFANPRTEAVSIGTVARLMDLTTLQPECYSILGAWDSLPEKHILSYHSPLAQSLLGKKVGDEIQFESEGTTRRCRVEAIEPYHVLPEGAPAAAAAAETQPTAA
jgi:transcription elongation GreA/GreB family factor